MINKILKRFVDLFYGTGRARREFELCNPHEKVLAADASKGIVTKKIKTYGVVLTGSLHKEQLFC